MNTFCVCCEGLSKSTNQQYHFHCCFLEIFMQFVNITLRSTKIQGYLDPIWLAYYFEHISYHLLKQKRLWTLNTTKAMSNKDNAVSLFPITSVCTWFVFGVAYPFTFNYRVAQLLPHISESASDTTGIKSLLSHLW